MALSSAIVWDVRTAGSDNSGGGFVAGASGTDYSQQTAAQYSGTDLAVDSVSNTKVTSGSHTFVAADVGNLIQVTAGAGFTVGFYQVVSVAGGAATLDRSPAATSTTGGTWALGGALASPGKALGARVAGNTIWLRAGNYPISSSTANVSGGRLDFNITGSATARIRLIGYQTTRGDNTGTKPVLQATIGSITVITLNNANSYNSVENVEVDGNAQATVVGIAAQGRCNYLLRCRVRNCTNYGITLNNNPSALLCEVTGCTGGNVAAFALQTQSSLIWGCTSHDNAARGFDLSSTATLVNCLSYNNTGSNGYGFFVQNAQTNILQNCTAYGNAQDGVFLFTGNTDLHCINCLSANNSGYGFNHSSAQHALQLFNCAAYSNTAGAYPTSGSSTPQIIEGFVPLSASPFVNAAGGNFALNSTAGGGAAAKAAGIPGALPTGGTGYADIGALQSAAAGGGGLRLTTFTGGMNG
jgi:hypothetical protein